MRAMIFLLGAFLIGGCQAADPLSGRNDPKNQWWSLSFVEPSYMKVWVEDTAVEDITGKVFRRTGSGAAASSEPEGDKEFARGWSNNISSSIRGVVGADLPKRIYVRWQSVVESKTYRTWVDIPEEARQLMHASVNERCPATPQEPANYITMVYLGLAPGGVVQVWVTDKCLKSIKVARAQAEIEPLGPHLGKSGGNYYPQSEKSKRYVERFGIPYGSW
ncbi:hypothetical protein BK666_18205 [Pseudomonas frederiksbergensis]|uniref:DUF2931 domain-containing protein n=1 Tax=Pseudomonas frederiksbergensis TaxID=104087 RepID=A0A423K0V2_9PSED|nr:DUF2931 family protein [Pseudomonas frederiksbergensis]RON44287.1 hypothetical protein BK666_18205 [Pseudomonas frederiksbergensis]